MICLFCFFQRKQKDVQKDNDFYVHLLQQALPPELQNAEKDKQKGLWKKGVKGGQGLSQDTSYLSFG